jgi:hypothetical protein
MKKHLVVPVLAFALIASAAVYAIVTYFPSNKEISHTASSIPQAIGEFLQPSEVSERFHKLEAKESEHSRNLQTEISQLKRERTAERSQKTKVLRKLEAANKKGSKLSHELATKAKASEHPLVETKPLFDETAPTAELPQHKAETKHSEHVTTGPTETVPLAEPTETVPAKTTKPKSATGGAKAEEEKAENVSGGTEVVKE